MKKTVLCLLSICLILLCGYYRGKYPTDYDGYRWVARDVDLYFDVSDEFYERGGGKTFGVLTVDGETTEIFVFHGPGLPFMLFPLSAMFDEDRNRKDRLHGELMLFTGYTIERTSRTFTIGINERKNGIIDDSITEITFDRIETPSE